MKRRHVRRLFLARETIRKLTSEDLRGVLGGTGPGNTSTASVCTATLATCTSGGNEGGGETDFTCNEKQCAIVE